MICPNCGTDHGDRQLKFCTVCGGKIEAPAPQSSQPYAPSQASLYRTDAPQSYGSSFDDLLRPQKKASSGKMILIIVAVALVLIAAVVVCVMLMSGRGGSVALRPQPEETLPVTEAVTEPLVMPNFVGMSYEEVNSFLYGTGCTAMFEYAYSDTFEENCVIEQSIPAGTTLPESGMVVIKVSKGADVAPEGYNQKVVVSANAGSSYGILTLYEWENGQWNSKYSCDATVGKNGISYDYGEGRKRTPQGVFKLGVALSANSIPNSDWPFHQVTRDTCIVDDTASIYYNTIQSIRSLSSGISYDPIGKTIVNGYSNICIFIEHNGNGFSSEGVVPGRCSVITICGRNSAIKPTLGCVDISATNMNALLSMLDYNKNPHIEIVAL